MTVPGSGFFTVIGTLPISAWTAVPVAVSLVAETKVVVSAVLFQKTCAPFTNFDPLTVKLTAPTFTGSGCTLCTTGTGFSSVTAASPDVISATFVAVTCTDVGSGSTAGAVYKPLSLIVPTVALPPATPLTDHCTCTSTLDCAWALSMKFWRSRPGPVP